MLGLQRCSHPESLATCDEVIAVAGIAIPPIHRSVSTTRVERPAARAARPAAQRPIVGQPERQNERRTGRSPGERWAGSSLLPPIRVPHTNERLEQYSGVHPGTLGDHVPRMRLLIDDLGKQSDDQIYARAATSFARLVLWALKNAREAGWLGGDHDRWKDLIAAVLAERDGTRALTALFR
jgi:hypothetical protein